MKHATKGLAWVIGSHTVYAEVSRLPFTNNARLNSDKWTCNVPPQLFFYINHMRPLQSPRAFSDAAPTVWNQLTVNTRTGGTLGTFKTRLKTELFTLAYPT